MKINPNPRATLNQHLQTLSMWATLYHGPLSQVQTRLNGLLTSSLLAVNHSESAVDSMQASRQPIKPLLRKFPGICCLRCEWEETWAKNTGTGANAWRRET